MNGWEITGTGLLLGLANGPACLASCAPAMLPVVLAGTARAGSGQFAWALLGRLLCGRLTAYALVGMLAGLSGGSLQAVSGLLAPWVTLLLALFLVGHGLGLFRRPACCSAPGHSRWFGSPMLLGMLTGFSLCPPFLLALTWVWGQGIGPLAAMLFFLAFFGGTSLYLLPLGFGGYLVENKNLFRLGRVLSLGAGLFFAVRLLADIVFA